MTFLDLVEESITEAERAMKRFPQPNYVITKLAEEAGEVVKAAIHCAEGREDYENLRKEMVQLIAMLYRLWAEGDEVHNLKPVNEFFNGEDYIRAAIVDFYGERCVEYLPSCYTCEAWKQYDEKIGRK